MDDSTLAAIERLRALGAVDVRVGDVRVRFEPMLAGELPDGDAPLDEAAMLKALEDLTYHSS